MITVTESTTAEGVQLALADYEYLLDLATVIVEDEEVVAPPVFKKVTKTRQPGVYRVQVGPYVGRVGLPSGDSVDIRSRFPFEDFVALLRRANRLPKVDVLSAAEKTGSFIVDALVYAFVREVQVLAGRGLAKDYVDAHRERPPFAGRPDVARHVARNAGRPERIPSVARVITTDVPVNRALRRGYDALRGCELRPELAGRLARLGPAFEPVQRVRMSGEEIALLAVDPRNARYRDALALAEVAVRGGALTPTVGQLAGASMLFYMPGVWQDCVAQWVREQHPQREVITEHWFPVTNRGGNDGRADVVVWERGRVTQLFDAKYKRFGKGPAPHDVYQMVAYCEALRLSEATLVYPGEIHGASEIRCGPRIVIRSVGLPL